MKRVLLLLPTASYRNDDFLAAAKQLNVDIVSAANYCHQLAPLWGMSPIQSAPFDQPEVAVKQLLAALGRKPDAVLAVDDAGLELAALLCERLHLPGNPPAAVRVTHDKLAFRRLLRSGGLNCPDFYHLGSDVQAATLLPPLQFPVVVKARRLSSSRGVIRADTPQAFTQAVRWVHGIQVKADRDAAKLGLVVESFIPGREHALEGLLQNGQLRVLALFDKPDPLDGPYFEETLYITPSRLPPAKQDQIAQTAQHACELAGLTSGSVHAEMRVNQQGVRRGIFQGAHNLDSALHVAGISDIQITANPGQVIAPPPEGASYLGFIFAHGTSPVAVESSLRQAHQRLVFEIQADIPVNQARA